jgi:type I restriction-modification system DNA methylase subunit
MADQFTRPQIRDRLTAFVARWSQRGGDEKSEAQTFLGELLDSYETGWRQNTDVRFEHYFPSGGFADLLWKGNVLVEMKSKFTTPVLPETHWRQLFDYWDRSSFPGEGIGAPRYVLLCSFDRFVVWEPGEYPVPVVDRPGPPRIDLMLDELPERVEALDFLRGTTANFAVNSVDLAERAVDAVARLYVSLTERGIGAEQARDFTLQVTWCCFAEDLGMFPELLLTDAAERLKADPNASSYDVLGELFEWLNRAGERPTGGAFRGAPYVNGGLFEHPAHVELTPAETDLLLTASRADWHQVEPAVFGGLFTGTLADERRRVSGAHYTPEAEIQKIVQPTIVRPWRERIELLTEPDAALALLVELAAFRVLDPACGSGNFLYVAYQQLRTLEAELKVRIGDLMRERGRALPADLPHVDLSNMLGIEKDPFAARLAQVVLWIGHKVAVDKHRLEEQVLPLADLSGIVCADALHIEWPETDAIVGNPPFIGSQNLRKAVGDDETAWIQKTFGVGVKDYCVYWFRRAHDHLEPGQRAGLVGTNSVSQNRARGVSLDYLVDGGGVITDAVSTQVWPGEAAVHVSLVNWVKQPLGAPPSFTLDGAPVTEISTSLTVAGGARAAVLEGNKGRSFQGPIPGDEGFVIDRSEAIGLLKRGEADYRRVVRPYLIGKDITTEPGAEPSRWVIDFAAMGLEDANRYPAALDIVRQRVKPRREQNRRKAYRDYWWRFSEPRARMRVATTGLDRYIAGTATGKRLVLAWAKADVCPSNLVNVFAFDDDYAMGVLLSRVHGSWAWAQSSTLKGDLRYTPTTVFATFPWPPSDGHQRAQIGEITKQLIALRHTLSIDRTIGLTTLYNECDEGAHKELRELHDQLDSAVSDAYGWPPSVLSDPVEITSRLLVLNAAIAAGEQEYTPFPPLAPPPEPQSERLFLPD